MFLHRHILPYLLRMLKQFKIILITGSRQVGKSTLLKQELGSTFDYCVLDDYSELDLAKSDPALFLKNHNFPLIIDEVQRVPELFLQLKYLADKSSEKGQIILTSSQSYHLIHNASESLAGRVCIIDMASLSLREKFQIDFNQPFLPSQEYISERKEKITPYKNLWWHLQHGSMPELLDDQIEWESFYRSYVRTYIERDVAELINVKNLLKFNNFMKCLAGHTGELLNCESLARDVGISVKTAQEWTSILESSGVIRLLHSYENNITNRTVKTPKVYFLDTGLVCYLVGWSNENVAMNGAMSGPLFENFVISEVIKSYYNSGHDAQNLYFYRDKDKREIDLVIEKDGILYPVEIKKSSRPALEITKSFSALKKISGKSVGQGCILCQCEKPLLLDEKIIALPLEFL